MSLAFFKRRWVLVLLGLLLLALVIWYAGPYLAFADVHPLESVIARLVTIAVIVALRVAFLLVKRLTTSRATDRFVAGVARPPAAAAERPTDEVLQLRERFEEAIRTLRQHRGARSLYELPWYVFIGAPGSGKTTALVNSGLKFPLEQRIGKGALRGVGGTRNCDWWFTDDAVFLDTAGRYTTQDSDVNADSAAWGEFLGLLRQYRRRRPLNGVILTISVQDLLTVGAEGRASNMTAARRRLDELQRNLRVRLPVYVVVTKCDLVAGFAEYFDDQTAEGRAQVWGVTFPYEQTTRGTAAQAFAGEFDALMTRLNERVFTRLDEESDARRRTKIFGFPQQMAALRGVLDEFVTEVFGSTRFDQRVLLRGVYLTSGTQEGTPIDRLMSAIGRRFALAPDAVLPPPGRGKAYFIERLLKEIVLGESGVAGVDWRQELRQGAVQLGAYAAMAAIAVIGVTALSVSYGRNSRYLAGVSKAVSTLAATPPVVAGAPLDAVLPRLDAVRRVADVANAYHDRTPWSMRWGLFQGRFIGDSARDAYARELSGGLLPHLAERIERRLTDYASQPDKLYEYLKAYLMLGNPEHLDKAHLGFVAEIEWSTGSTQEMAAALSKHFKGLLAEGVTLPSLPLNDSLVAQARATIRRASIPQLVYNRLKLTHADETSRGLRLDESSGVGADRVLRRRSGRPLSERIPYLYTAAGFKEVTGAGAANLVVQFASDAWVWGEGGPALGDSVRLGAGVIDCYERDYIAAWDGILQDVDLVPFTATGDALAILAAPTSPLRGLLQTVDDNTYLVKPADSSAGVMSSAQQTLNKLFAQGKAAAGLATPTPGAAVTAHFASIHQLMTGPPGSAPIDRILSQVQAIRQGLLSTGTGPGQTRPLDVVGDAQLNATLTALKQDAALLPPVVRALISQVSGRTQAAVSSGATSDLLARYQQDVHRECAAIIEGRYPFTPTSTTEVPMDDFGRLFGYGGVFDAFFTAHLEKLVDTTRPSWEWRPGSVGTSPGMLREFEFAQRVRRMFFQPGSRTPQVQFAVTATEMDIGKFVLDINGKRFEYKQGTPRSFAVAWPGDGPGQVVATFDGGMFGGKSNKSFEGPWAWFRLLDFAGVQKETDIRSALRLAFGGHSVRVRLEATRIENPFTDRSWQQFRCGF